MLIKRLLSNKIIRTTTPRISIDSSILEKRSTKLLRKNLNNRNKEDGKDDTILLRRMTIDRNVLKLSVVDLNPQKINTDPLVMTKSFSAEILREFCSLNSLGVSGNKNQLVDRIRKFWGFIDEHEHENLTKQSTPVEKGGF